MVKFLLEWAVLGLVAWLVWDAGYKRGKHDLMTFLAYNYIVLPKGAYCCHKVAKTRKIKIYKKRGNKNGSENN